MRNNARVEMVLKMIKNNPAISSTQIARELKCTRQNIYALLASRGYKRIEGEWVYDVRNDRSGAKEHYAFMDSCGGWFPLGKMPLGLAIEMARSLDSEFRKIAIIRPYEPRINALRVIEEIQDDACFYYECAEGWLDGLQYNSPEVHELSEKLNGVLQTWLKKHHLVPHFFTVESEVYTND